MIHLLCWLRFENYDQFYDDPEGSLDASIAPLGICGNESTSQSITTFNQAVEDLLSDIRVATPRSSDFYTASKRQVGDSNTTLYAIGQCVENVSQVICKDCLSTSYNSLYNCLPAAEGRAINVGCFMRYSEFPFFQDNQTINLIPLLDEGEHFLNYMLLCLKNSMFTIFFSSITILRIVLGQFVSQWGQTYLALSLE